MCGWVDLFFSHTACTCCTRLDDDTVHTYINIINIYASPLFLTSHFPFLVFLLRSLHTVTCYYNIIHLPPTISCKKYTPSLTCTSYLEIHSKSHQDISLEIHSNNLPLDISLKEIYSNSLTSSNLFTQLKQKHQNARRTPPIANPSMPRPTTEPSSPSSAEVELARPHNIYIYIADNQGQALSLHPISRTGIYHYYPEGTADARAELSGGLMLRG